MNFSSSLPELPLEVIFYIIVPYLCGNSCCSKRLLLPEDMEAKNYLQVCTWGREAMFNMLPQCFQSKILPFDKSNLQIRKNIPSSLFISLDGKKEWCQVHQHVEYQICQNIITKEKSNRTWLFDPPFKDDLIYKGPMIANQAYHLSEHDPPILTIDTIIETFQKIFQHTNYRISHRCCHGKGIMYGKKM